MRLKNSRKSFSVLEVILLLAVGISLIIIVPVSINRYGNVNVGTWITTIGTVFGAFGGAWYAGKYAIKSVKTQNELEQERINDEKIKNEEITAYKLASCYHSIIFIYQEFDKYIQENRLTTRLLKRQRDILNSSYFDLDRLDTTVFSNSLFSEMHDAKMDFKNRLLDFDIMIDEFYEKLEKEEINSHKIAYVFYEETKGKNYGFVEKFKEVRKSGERMLKLYTKIYRLYDLKKYD